MKVNRVSLKVIAIVAIVMAFGGCKNVDEEVPVINEAEIYKMIDDGVDIRTIDDATEKSATANPVDAATGAEVNLGQYPIVIKDSYGDRTYLKDIDSRDSKVPSGLVGYRGVFVYRGKAYEATAIYNTSTKHFALTIGYEYNIRYLYDCSWRYENYFVGAFSPIFQYSKEYRSDSRRMKKITCTLNKGSFPGMNND